jgi:hypothetical protein
MAKRILLAGVLGGIAMFFWSSLAHIVFPLGETGVGEIPNESAVLTAMHASLGDHPGLYLFPATGAPPNATRQERNAAMQQYGQKLAANPSGLLIYHPPGANALTPRQLVTEFANELLESIILGFLLAQMRLTSFGGRVGVAVLAGLMASITTNISYWNWYGFPTSYTIAYLGVEWVGFSVAGIVAALVLGKKAKLSTATA